MLLSSNCKALYKDAWNAAAHGNALLFAAGPSSVVYLEVRSDRNYICKRLRPVSYYIYILDRCCKTPVLDETAAFDIKSEISFSYLDFSVAELVDEDALVLSIYVQRILGIGLYRKDSLRPLPVGETPKKAALIRSCRKQLRMPSLTI